MAKKTRDKYYLGPHVKCPQFGCKNSLFVPGIPDLGNIPNLRLGLWCAKHGQARLMTEEEIDFIVDRVAPDNKVEGEEDARRWARES